MTTNQKKYGQIILSIGIALLLIFLYFGTSNSILRTIFVNIICLMVVLGISLQDEKKGWIAMVIIIVFFSIVVISSNL